MENNNSFMDLITSIPKLSFVLTFVGFLYLLISVIQFGFQFYDKSQLITNIVIGCSIFVLAYVYWYFKTNDRKIDDIHKDFQSFDNRLNRLENSFITFKNKHEL